MARLTGGPSRPTRVHRALTALPEGEQRRLGVTADWKNGPHLLTYRQTEYTSGLVAGALGKDEPDGLPSPELQAVCDQLLEASVPRTCTPTTAIPGAPTTAPSSPTAISTARRHRGRCWNRAPSPQARPGNKPQHTTRRPPRPPAASSAASPLTTPTATTGSSARPPPARSAARSAPRR